MNTEPKNKGGRPPLPEGEARVSFSIRYRPEHLAKIQGATVAEFDALLEAWKPKTKRAPKKKPAE